MFPYTTDFVNRDQLKNFLTGDICARAFDRDKPPILLDSPAGSGKTRLLLEVSRLVAKTCKHIRLDFRREPNGTTPYPTEQSVLEEIARQACLDTAKSNIYELVQLHLAGDSKARALLEREMETLPEADAQRKEMLAWLAKAEVDNLPEAIKKSLTEEFKKIDLQPLTRLLGGQSPQKQFFLFKDFLKGRHKLPPEGGSMLVIFDSLELAKPEVQTWILETLAFNLIQGLHENGYYVIVAGHALSQRLSSEAKMKYVIYRLEALTPRYIKELLLRNYPDPDFAGATYDTQAESLARKLTQACGGHPGLIKAVAKKLYAREANPGNFHYLVFDPTLADYWYTAYASEYLKEARQAATQQIIGPRSAKALEPEEPVALALHLLSCFRCFGSTTLAVLLPKARERFSGDPHWKRYIRALLDPLEEDANLLDRLFVELQETDLIWDEGLGSYFYSGGILFQLEAAHWREARPEWFAQINLCAAELFGEWFSSQDADAPFQAACLREWLFHRLTAASLAAKPAAQLAAILDELRQLLAQLKPVPSNRSENYLRQKVKRLIAKEIDWHIDHLLWEIVGEDKRDHDKWATELLNIF